VIPPNEGDPRDLRPAKEAEAAAHEAGGVGGRAPTDEDPARRPVDEAGGGQAEGFERAEEDLRENAEHGQLGPRDPRRDAFPGEEESDVADSAYGEADHERSTERTGEP
jgi:hypothetical protein